MICRSRAKLRTLASVFIPFCLLYGADPVAAAAESIQQVDDRVSLNFVGADIESVLRALGKVTGRNFVLDPRVKGNLSITTARPVAPSLVYPILLSALRLQGYAAIEENGVVKVLPEADAKQHAAPLLKPRAIAAGGDQLATEVFTLQHEAANQMLAVVRPLVSPSNSVSVLPGANTLVVTDYAGNLARIRAIIESLDVPQGDVQIIPVHNASAVDLAATLARLYAEPANPPEGGGRLTVLADARSNALLVRGDNRARLQALRSLASQLDRPGVAGNIRVVYLKNAVATEVAATLRAVLSGQTEVPANNGGLHNAGLTPLSSSNSPGSAASGLNVTANFPPTGVPAAGAPGARSNGYAADGDPGAAIVQADAASNALIVTAPEPIYNSLRGVIEQLDRRRAQVYVEALIAEISADRAAEFGIQWQAGNLSADASGSRIIGGTNFGTGGQNILQLATDPASASPGLNVVLGSGEIEVLGTRILDLSLLARFLETQAEANILSTPNLVTLDNEPAQIVVGQNLPFLTGQYANTGGGTTPANPFQTIERRDVGLTLRIRPQISEGGTVKLQIYQEASSVASLTNAAGPITNKRALESTVLVDDGAVIAIGGLIEDNFSAGQEKVPLLGDLPWIGNLFRYDTRSRRKTNLVIFLRPRILRDAESYRGFSTDRYEYVIGRQRALEGRNWELPQEGPPPRLPPVLPEPYPSAREPSANSPTP